MKEAELVEVLRLHRLFLAGDGEGSKADLRLADLDFSSGIPFRCGGTKIIGDDRLVSQLIYHLTRQDWQHTSPEIQAWLATIPKEIANGFCKFRTDVEPV